MKKNRRKSFVGLTTAMASLALEQYDEALESLLDSARHREGTSNELTRLTWYDLQRISTLGQGVYSNVDLVVSAQSRKQYALKSLNAEKLSNPLEFIDAAHDFAREVILLSKLEHDNIIQLRGMMDRSYSQSFQEEGEGYFFVMDVLHETLKERLSRWRADWKTRCSLRNRLFSAKRGTAMDATRSMYGRVETVALGIVRGMRYLHEEHSIVLRDLKPSNIGFDAEDGKVRLIDFGMSRHIDECKPEEVVGTPRYMAPEVMECKGTSFASDVYSFGVVLYEIASLKIAFSEQKTLEGVEQHVLKNNSRPSLDSIPCKMMQSLIEECWARRPEDRPTFQEIHRRLLMIIDHGKSLSNPPTSIRKSKPKVFGRKRSSSEATRRTLCMADSFSLFSGEELVSEQSTQPALESREVSSKGEYLDFGVETR